MIPLVGAAVWYLARTLATWAVVEISLRKFNSEADDKEKEFLAPIMVGVGGLAVVAILYAMSQKGGK